MVGSELLVEGKKRKKIDTRSSEEVTSCEDLSVASARDGATDSTKARKKKTRQHKDSDDAIELSANRYGNLVFEDGVCVDNNKAKKTKRMLEFGNQMKEDLRESGKKNELNGENCVVAGLDVTLKKNDQIDAANISVSKATKHAKKNLREKMSKEKANSLSSAVTNLADNTSTKVVEGLQWPKEKEIAGIDSKEGGNEKRKKKKRHESGADLKATKHTGDFEVGNGSKDMDESMTGKIESPREEPKKHKKKIKSASKAASTEEIMAESCGNETGSMGVDGGHGVAIRDKAGDKNFEVDALGTDVIKDGKRKRKKDKNGNTVLTSYGGGDAKEAANKSDKVVHSDKQQKKKKKKKHHIADFEDVSQKVREKMVNGSSVIGDDEVDDYARKKKKGKIAVGDRSANEEVAGKVEGKKVMSGKKGIKKLPKIIKNTDETGLSEKSTSKSGSKRVSFSEDVQVFPSVDDSTEKIAVQEDDLVRGKRFTREEDEKIKEAVLNYIDSYNLGEEGLEMVMNCRKHPQVKNCWKEIAAALPHRPSESIYYRAHILFLRDKNRKWTQEEYDIVQKYYEKHGPDWKTLADALGKHRFHVKEAWRRMRLPNAKKGAWSQEEYQSLFDLVNKDLRMKAFEEERKSKHGMLRDNISWMAISSKLETRTDALCCMKWYDQLTSPMVAEGEWSDTDDYRLLDELYNQDAFCMEDVDWDNLLEHRSGDVCRKRWNQMVKHLGEHANKSFSDQIEVLIGRYCPDVLEARDAYNQKPIVP